MGFLHKLWDETLAGPAPESGLGKLRKYNSFSAVRSAPPNPVIVSPDHTPVSRSITILRSISSAGDPGSAPVSPAGPSTPTSPFSPSTPRGDLRRKARKKTTPDNADPIVYDWIVINALDR